MPCPLPPCGMITVRAQVRSIRINALGENWGSPGTPSLAPRADGTANSRNNPPPAAAPTWRKSRREMPVSRIAGKPRVAWSGIVRPNSVCRVHCRDLGRVFYRRPNAHIGSAPTDIPGHCGVDIGVSRMRRRAQKRASGHDLTRLTVAALHDLGVEPSLLNAGT